MNIVRVVEYSSRIIGLKKERKRERETERERNEEAIDDDDGR